jgi:hypothetical protein
MRIVCGFKKRNKGIGPIKKIMSTELGPMLRKIFLAF